MGFEPTRAPRPPMRLPLPSNKTLRDKQLPVASSALPPGKRVCWPSGAVHPSQLLGAGPGFKQSSWARSGHLARLNHSANPIYLLKSGAKIMVYIPLHQPLSQSTLSTALLVQPTRYFTGTYLACACQSSDHGTPRRLPLPPTPPPPLLHSISFHSLLRCYMWSKKHGASGSF